MARTRSKKKNNWRGGSFTAALGGYCKRKAKRAGKRLWASFKKDTLGIKAKKR